MLWKCVMAPFCCRRGLRPEGGTDLCERRTKRADDGRPSATGPGVGYGGARCLEPLG
jgi:hypothetical protein